MKPLLVGESNPYGVDPFYALYPLPEGASGHRLQVILGMTRDQYLSTFDRCNLLSAQKWDVRLAKESALALLASPYSRYILLGSRVAAAFGFSLREHMFRPCFVMLHESKVREVARNPVTSQVLVLPHPSGLNRIWNEPLNISAARNAVADFLVE